MFTGAAAMFTGAAGTFTGAAGTFTGSVHARAAPGRREPRDDVPRAATPCGPTLRPIRGADMTEPTFRLVTRSDFDGLVCAVLLRSLNLIDEIEFVHPKDVQDGIVPITDRDILTNLPYAAAAHMVFDHHHSETLRNAVTADNHVIDGTAKSAARVVFDHFGGERAFPEVSDELMRAVDQADSADYSLEDILHPTGWTLLNYLMDSRTGLGRFRDFRISNYQLMMQLIDLVLHHEAVDEILATPDVQERVALFREQTVLFTEQLHRVSSVRGDLVVVDLRTEEVIHAGNRFMIYALFPKCRVSAHLIWGKQRQNTVIACGKSILDRTSPTDLGALMLRYDGGGHHAAGTCQVPHEQALTVLAEIADAVNALEPVA
jgi:nanoRNase/pAp phosphatase (c-di-AMP/oligoRNAs hydrolase)